MRDKPTSVEAYLDAVESSEARASLQNLRQVLKSELPDAEECISYGIPTFKQAGFIVSYAAFKKHCSFFPGHTVRDFTEELKGYKVSKGTIQFLPNAPLPEGLVRAIVRARLAENLANKR